ncbi:MAG: uracil-DNA glycosylase [Bacteroidetes bacterium]|nr:MAG: uracil-DNA glycosylase [Bacteroidota bacterium]
MAHKVNPEIESGWKEVLKEEFEKPYFPVLKEFLIKERANNVVYPPGPQIFAAFNHTPFKEAKVVILGQDPYHGPGQAHGLCFSVPAGIAPPPSLINIFKELKSDLGIPFPGHGNLEKWAKQGILLLNATLTVRANNAGSHQKKGWETFTDRAIELLSQKRKNLVFILWGNYAIKKTALIDASKHLVLTSVHPSPLSASRGFFGCRHFSKTNEYLSQNSKKPIDWNLNSP